MRYIKVIILLLQRHNYCCASQLLLCVTITAVRHNYCCATRLLLCDTITAVQHDYCYVLLLFVLITLDTSSKPLGFRGQSQAQGQLLGCCTWYLANPQSPELLQFPEWAEKGWGPRSAEREQLSCSPTTALLPAPLI